MEVLFLFFLLEFALAFDAEHIVFELDVEVALLEAGDFDVEDDFVLILIDVDRGNESGSDEGVIVVLGAVVLLEERVHAVLECEHVAEGIPTSDSHGENLQYVRKVVVLGPAGRGLRSGLHNI
jgi:hypothetical protein